MKRVRPGFDAWWKQYWPKAPAGFEKESFAQAEKAFNALTPLPPKVPTSRTERWSDACSRASSGLEDLISLKEEYEELRDNVPENLQQGAYYEKLDEICNLDLDSAKDSVDEAEGMDLPLGFGRD